MEQYLNKGVKDVISEYPEIGKILDSFQIGCVSCKVGTCLLKDVVDIHNLDPELKANLMCQIEEKIYPARTAKKGTSATQVAPIAYPAEIVYSDPIKKLVEEHKHIKRWIALIPQVVERVNQSGLNRQLINNILDFIRIYADRFHHAKEEDILFKYVDESLEIIQVMYMDHTTARNHVQSIILALKEDDGKTVIEHLLAYGELLMEHIKKEDEILYPWIDQLLNASQVQELKESFSLADVRVDEDIQKIDELFKNLGEWEQALG